MQSNVTAQLRACARLLTSGARPRLGVCRVAGPVASAMAGRERSSLTGPRSPTGASALAGQAGSRRAVPRLEYHNNFSS